MQGIRYFRRESAARIAKETEKCKAKMVIETVEHDAEHIRQTSAGGLGRIAGDGFALA
ncbi:hypothetical protein FACS1894170_04640 [Planctomycetales bacterium]|nr:hypothetical protein FACS1894170_04640 [Planctomycetales bacterium]